MGETIVAVRYYNHVDKPTKKNADLACLEVAEPDLKILTREEGFYGELLREINAFTQLHKELIESFLPSIYQIKFNEDGCHRGNTLQWNFELNCCKDHINFYQREIKMINPNECSSNLKWVLDQWNDGFAVIRVI